MLGLYLLSPKCGVYVRSVSAALFFGALNSALLFMSVFAAASRRLLGTWLILAPSVLILVLGLLELGYVLALAAGLGKLLGLPGVDPATALVWLAPFLAPLAVTLVLVVAAKRQAYVQLDVATVFPNVTCTNAVLKPGEVRAFRCPVLCVATCGAWVGTERKTRLLVMIGGCFKRPDCPGG